MLVEELKYEYYLPREIEKLGSSMFPGFGSLREAKRMCTDNKFIHLNSSKELLKIDIVKLALTIQLVVFGLIGLNAIGINIPILREITLFIYLVFLPGMLILRILNVNTNLTKTLLLSSGISSSFIMIFFALENTILVSLGFERPLSELPLLLSSTIVILLFIGVCKWKRRNFFTLLYSTSLLSPNTLVFLLLPFLSVIGAYILSTTGNNLLLLLLLLLISMTPLTISLSRLQEKIYSLIIWVISISLAFHTPLSYIETPHEAVVPGVVKTAGIWDPSFPYEQNSLLSNAILHPVLSILMGMDVVPELIVVNCFYASLIPLIMYEIHSSFFDRRISFLSSCLFAFYPYFYIELAMGSIRTCSAIYFLSLFILSVFSKEISPTKRKFLALLFIFSVITSHYGTSYLLLLIVSSIALTLFLCRKFLRGFAKKSFITPTFCVLYFVLSLSWYLYISGSTCFGRLIGFGRNVITHLSELLQPTSSATMEWTFSKAPSFSIEVSKYLTFVIIFLILIGVLKLLHYRFLKGREIFNDEYITFVIAFSLALLTLLLPHTTMALRIFAISLVLTAPFSVVGLSTILKFARFENNRKHLIAFSMLLIMILSFGGGLISNTLNAITGKTVDFSPNKLIDRPEIQKGNNFDAKWFLYWHFRPSCDVNAIEWLLRYHNPNKKIYVDYPLTCAPKTHMGTKAVFRFLSVEYGGRIIYDDMKPPKLASIKTFLEGSGDKGEYILLGYHNVVEDLIIIGKGETFKKEKQYFKTSDYKNIFNSESKIYDVGDSIIYLTQ